MTSDIRNPLMAVSTLNYSEYLQQMKQKIHLDKQNLQTFDKIEQIKLNYHRNTRLSTTNSVSRELGEILNSVSQPQTWYLLTEDWCGDSNQILPCLAKMVQTIPIIRLKMVLRDSHPEIMGNYLTDGKRAIPKLISLDSEGRELFLWGPRPQPARKIFEDSLSENPSRERAKAKLHSWYGRDHCRTLEKEIAGKLRNLG